MRCERTNSRHALSCCLSAVLGEIGNMARIRVLSPAMMAGCWAVLSTGMLAHG